MSRVSLILAVLLAVTTAARSAGPSTMPTTQPAALRVAIYADTGASTKAPGKIEIILTAAGLHCERLTAADIRAGRLAEFDVLVQPGGSGSGQAKTLGDEGREAIRKFVNGGKGYLGVCAGSYLASSGYTWSLGLINAKVMDRQHWARGNGTVKVRLTEPGKSFLGATDEVVSIYYAQGPLLAPAERKDLPAYKAMACFETEMVKNGAIAGTMKGTTAVATAEYGKGRVCCFSPHPEATKPLNSWILRAVLWTASRPMP